MRCKSMECSLEIFLTAGVVKTREPGLFIEMFDVTDELGAVFRGVASGVEVGRIVVAWRGWISTNAEPTYES